MNYSEYMKQFEGMDCYFKRDTDNDGMTVYFYSTQPNNTQFGKLLRVGDDFVVFQFSRPFDEDITYNYQYSCPLGMLYVEVEDIVQG